MITAGLYKICTQILIRSINSVSAVSDKLGHSCKAGLLASGGFTLRRNTHSCCCWDKREESGALKERKRGGWTRQQIAVVWVVKADLWSLRFMFLFFFFFQTKVYTVPRNRNQPGFFLRLHCLTSVRYNKQFFVFFLTKRKYQLLYGL